jgi:hypothetical protein
VRLRQDRRAPRRKLSPAAVARSEARSLVVDLLGGAQPDCPLTDLGIVLGAGEIVWREVALGLWSKPPGWAGWSRWGMVPCWLTSLRLVGRLPSGDLFGIGWGDVCGCVVELEADRVILDGPDGSRYCLAGAAAPVVAVAAVAYLYGLDALSSHPGLACLRGSDESSLG